jgi:hypothetical protein
MALAFYVALVSFSPDSYEPIGSYLALVESVLVEPMEKFIGRARPFILVPIAYFVAVIMLGWPQVAFALIGGFLSRRFKITITRR